MAKRASARSIRTARTYTIEEAALALNVSFGTVRNWVKAGLSIMNAQRPYLILGESLRDFLQDRAAGGKVKLQPGQLYCFICKVGRSPMGLMVDCLAQTPRTARLIGLCEVCGGTCNRMISVSKIIQFSAVFELERKDGTTA